VHCTFVVTTRATSFLVIGLRVFQSVDACWCHVPDDWSACVVKFSLCDVLTCVRMSGYYGDLKLTDQPIHRGKWRIV